MHSIISLRRHISTLRSMSSFHGFCGRLLVTLGFALLLPSAVPAAEYPSGDLTYIYTDTDSGDGVTLNEVSSASGVLGAVTIPSTLGGKPVVNVDNQGGSCFGWEHASTATSLSFPSTVTNIGDSTFYGCSGLKTVEFPSCLARIGEDAFTLCTNLTTLTFPASLMRIEGLAFHNCTGLSTVYFEGNKPLMDEEFTFQMYNPEWDFFTNPDVPNAYVIPVTFYAYEDATGFPTDGILMTRPLVLRSRSTPPDPPAPTSVTVSFNGNGGSVGRGSASLTSGAAYGTLPTATRAGYTFNGWRTSDGTPVTASSTVPSSNVVLYAQWAVVHYSITYVLGDGVDNSANPASHTIEDAVTLRAPTRSGYDFIGWSPAGTIAKGSTGDRTFTASWTRKSTLAFGPGEASTFKVSGTEQAFLVGVSGLNWGNFVLTEYKGEKDERRASESLSYHVFTDPRVIDVEKNSTVDDFDDTWCTYLSEVNALYWAGWLPSFANVDAVKDYMKSGKAYGDDAFNNGYSSDYESSADSLPGLVSQFSAADRWATLCIVFEDYQWKGSIGVGHCVTCCGYSLDSAKNTSDPTCLKGLFLVDSDNDMYNGAGGKDAPNTITYCPCSWDAANKRYNITGSFGATGWFRIDEMLFYRTKNVPTLNVVDGDKVTPVQPEPTPVPDPTEASERLCNGVQNLPELTSAAAVYDGYLYDADGNTCGIVQVKSAKAKLNRKTGKTTSRLTVTITPAGGKKMSLKGEMDMATGKIGVTAKDGRALSLTLGKDGMIGTFGSWTVDGARNVFTAKDVASKGVAASALSKWKGAVGVAWKEDAGWSALSVVIAAKGKAKVTGTLANGTKVSVNSQLVVGEQHCCVPVVYSKKVALAFNIWLPRNGGVVEVTGLDGTAVAGKVGTTLGSYVDFGVVPAEYNRFRNTKDEAFKMKLTAKTGIVKGTYKLRYIKSLREKKATVSVVGVLIGPTAYCVATIKKVGSWGMRISTVPIEVEGVPKSGALNSSRKYCVIDLAGGPSAKAYSISYLDDVPAGGWSDEYKTTKLVLRYIEPGTFMMGSPESELGRFNDWTTDPEWQHQVTITKGFYMSVFEVTSWQYILVMGKTPLGSDYKSTYPVTQVSWNAIRGNGATYDWPSTVTVAEDSFMGVLRTKTGVGGFDLPTEAQWEYACRAGTTTAFNNGREITFEEPNAALDEIGKGSMRVVGSYAWGLYDMHGNLKEWCLDWWDYYQNQPENPVVDPTGPVKGWYRVVRGGYFSSVAAYYRSAYRDSNYEYGDNGIYGIRLCCPAE